MENGRGDRLFDVRDLEYPGGRSVDGHTKQVQPVLEKKERGRQERVICYSVDAESVRTFPWMVRSHR